MTLDSLTSDWRHLYKCLWAMLSMKVHIYSPVYKAENTAVGIHRTDHVAPSIGRYSFLADLGHGVFSYTVWRTPWPGNQPTARPGHTIKLKRN
jgi:hypothetical protein